MLRADKNIIKTAAAAGSALVLLACLIFTLNFSHNLSQKRNFDNEVISTVNTIKAKADSYEQLAAGISQLADKDGISKEDWDSYFKTADLERYKGLSSVSYSKHVTDEGKQAYEQQYYKIYPSSDKDEYLPVTFITPDDQYKTYLGFDSGITSPSRYQWIAKARDTNTIQRSDVYEFDPGNDQEIFSLMFITVPVYKSNEPLENTENRRANYTGTVLATLKLIDLVPALISSTSNQPKFDDIEIYDKPGPDSKLMYDSNQESQASSNSFYKTVEADLGSRPLLVAFGSSKKPPPYSNQLGLLALTSGLVLIFFSRIKRQTRHE